MASNARGGQVETQLAGHTSSFAVHLSHNVDVQLQARLPVAPIPHRLYW